MPGIYKIFFVNIGARPVPAPVPDLVRMVDQHWPGAKLLRAGFSAKLTDRATTLIRRNRFKRRLPTIAKLKEL
jgi:hypothetical protein